MRTGDTLCDANKQVILERMEFPDPVIEIAIEPKSKADQEKLGLALAKLAAEDPSFRVSTDQESGQTILKGMGELHLDIKVDILRRTYKVDANIGAPQVAYRETVTRKAEIDYTHKKQTGGSGQFARVKLAIFDRASPGSGFVFDSKVIGGAVPKEYIPGVEKGLKSVLDNGVLAGFPVIDFKVTLIDGAYHEVDSSALAFEIASRAALREGIQKAGPKLLEPIMKVEVVTPRGISGRRHRRPDEPARPGAGAGDARQCDGHERARAAGQYVRLCEHAALDEPGSCVIQYAVRSLRAGATECGRRGSGEVRLRARLEPKLRGWKDGEPDGQVKI